MSGGRGSGGSRGGKGDERIVGISRFRTPNGQGQETESKNRR